MVSQSSHSANISDATTQPFAANDIASRPVDLLSVFGHPERTSTTAPELLAQVQTTRAVGDASPSRQIDTTASLSKLTSDASQNMDGAHHSEFMGEVNAFLALAKQKNLSQEEVNRTLDATAQLLEGQGQNPLSQTDRVWLATTLMHNLSHPDRVDQGYHNTCNVTAISKILMVTEPATVAEMISSTALNGYYQAADGKRIAIDAQSLQPDHEATGGETRDNRRNYANQVFDLISINNYWQRQNPPFSYIQKQTYGPGDTGERMVNAFGQMVKNEDGTYMDMPNLDCRAMTAIGHELGFKGDFLISNTRSDGDGAFRVDSPDQLSQTIVAMLKAGHPAMLFVNEGNKLFTGKNDIPGKGWHVVTIDSYDSATGQFHLSNQWGGQNDQMVSIANLYDATLPDGQSVKDPTYFNKQIFEARMHYMADGGAGLSPNQVLTGTEFNQFISDQKKQMQRESIQLLLDDLTGKLQAARAANDEPEVKRLEDWISQTKQGLQ